MDKIATANTQHRIHATMPKPPQDPHTSADVANIRGAHVSVLGLAKSRRRRRLFPPGSPLAQLNLNHPAGYPRLLAAIQ